MTLAPLPVAPHGTTAPAMPAPNGDQAPDSWPEPADSTEPTLSAGSSELPPVPTSLEDATTRQLRRWSNQLYRLLDTDAPPFGVREDCYRVAAELELREERARNGFASPARRDAFRDNPANRRFELFQNGMLAGYLAYTLRAGALRLHRTVVMDAFEGTGAERVLIRKVLLSAHKRRLAAFPYCTEVQAFLRENPEFRALIAH